MYVGQLFGNMCADQFFIMRQTHLINSLEVGCLSLAYSFRGISARVAVSVDSARGEAE